MLKDSKVTKAIINERRELSVNLLIKSGDYTEQEAELLRKCKIDGNTLDFMLSGLGEVEISEELKKARQALGIIMEDYAKSFHYDIREVEKALYTRRKITSRTELSLAELQEERESYLTAIRTGQP